MWNALTLAALLALPTAALAKPWNGIDPGTSKRDDVVKKFGEPSKVVKSDGKEVLAYLGEKALKGTAQAQFKVDAQTGTVERIDVFPAQAIDMEMVESSYGPACPAGAAAPKEPKEACYKKKMAGDDFKPYIVYQKLGLAIFFKEDNKTVSTLVFTPLAPSASRASGGGGSAGGSAGGGSPTPDER